MMNWSKYPAIALVSARSNMAYLSDVASRFIFLGIVLYIFTCLWRATFAATQASSLGGLSLPQMLWYLVITESIVMSGPRVSQVVDDDVRTGSLSVQLIRPISYPIYKLWATLGERAVRFALNLFVGSMVILVLVGPPAISPLGLVAFALAIPLAFVLDFLCNFLIGLGAFWLEDTSGFLLLYSRITMILGGMLLPLELMPNFLRPLLKALPFSSIVYGPAHVLVLPSVTDLLELLARQGIAVAVMSLIVCAVYKSALRRVFANGG